MYETSPSVDEDKYTNPELFSNPGSHGDELLALDDHFHCFDNGSEIGSDNFYLPPLPPDPKESQGDVGSSLKTLQALMATTAPQFLQQVGVLVTVNVMAVVLVVFSSFATNESFPACTFFLNSGDELTCASFGKIVYS